MTGSRAAAAPLADIQVIEIATMIAAPAAAHLLASYGADVIKVEDTHAGDGLRYYGSTKNGMSGWYANSNAGKRSIALDLKTDDGQAIFRRLVQNADVLLEGFRSGVMDRLGLGYDTLSELNPGLVYCSSSGFGSTGPYASKPTYDPLIQALSGWAGNQRVDDDPTLVRAMVADKVGAYNNAQAIMAALIQRARTGRGCFVETNMLDANIAFVWPDVMMDSTLTDDSGVEHRPNLLDTYRLYTSADGWVSIAIGTDDQWRRTCEALGRLDVAEDARFKLVTERSANIRLWYDAIDEMASAFPTADVVARLEAADVPVAPVLEPADVFDHPQVRATNTVQQSTHPVIGAFRHPRPRAAQFGEDIALSPAPRWGEHTAEILDELGYAKSDIRTFTDAGVTRQP